MRRYPVRSSALRAVGYDFETSTLEVEFASGGVYDYEDVPPEAALQLLEADSLGRHLAEHIRGAYRSHRAA
ncbi:KTSC domain-containing protein [Amnibacterium setariae]|uniref:KTSC domain-containing protein n=1 Tax=Amnibacterium setariae TaxID=2306585 RepID=A0A3A1TTH3_9MICO|nr:KTSC domain-containing protein [Amnibacterium setariae]RIX27522.1 KTSC domain-containing protein [Amnibacterium setariae]